MKEVVKYVMTLCLLVLMQVQSIGQSNKNPDAVTGATNSLSQKGNSLYHQTDALKFAVGELVVAGEVQHAGKVDLRKLYPREVFVKETILNEKAKPEFVGAYRYIGYSLFDILHPFIAAKKNLEVFRPSIDLFVIISNDAGESVAFSWSEIFHTNIPHQIIIATEVAQIKPYKKEVDYATGGKWKVVAASDLFAHRYLENPTSISVRSFDRKEYPIKRKLEPMFSPEIEVVLETGQRFSIQQVKDDQTTINYHSTFYGMGMGYHPVPEFSGIPLYPTFMEQFPEPFVDWLQNGLLCFASIDGYRAIFSFSELFNRSDQMIPLLVIPQAREDGGYYRIFLPTDFYADRSVKSLQEIFLFKVIEGLKE